MSAVTSDRWTCESCGRTVVIDAGPVDVACCLIAVQLRHGRIHQAAERAQTRRRTA